MESAPLSLKEMKSVLENRPQLKRCIDEVAEVAGYLWEKGWAERNGGNIVVNITEWVDEELAGAPAIAEKVPMVQTLPQLRGCWFFCKGTNRRMRDLARYPMENGSIIRICDDCASYEIVADNPVKPTSELASHLAMHALMLERGNGYKASLHTHPIELVAMTHHRPFLEKDVLTKLLWSMIPETRAFCPKGLGIIPYEMPSSAELADATVAQFDEYDVNEIVSPSCRKVGRLRFLSVKNTLFTDKAPKPSAHTRQNAFSGTNVPEFRKTSRPEQFTRY